MNYQRQSDCPRKGHTEAEFRITQALQLWSNPITDHAVCFECGKQWPLWDPDSYPSICANPSCHKKYNGPGMYCLPDVILEVDGSRAVIFVNGKVHDDKLSRKHLDRYQMLRLREYGYKIFVIKNEEIHRLRKSSLAAMARSWTQATNDQALYDKLLQGEKEF